MSTIIRFMKLMKTDLILRGMAGLRDWELGR
jgi:hypothetical protein